MYPSVTLQILENGCIALKIKKKTSRLAKNAKNTERFYVQVRECAGKMKYFAAKKVYPKTVVTIFKYQFELLKVVKYV